MASRTGFSEDFAGAGVGAARKPPRWLRVGETVEVEIEGIGVLRNLVETGP